MRGHPRNARGQGPRADCGSDAVVIRRFAKLDGRRGNPIVEAIGTAEFEWLARTFGRETTLQEIPDSLLERLASVDVTLRDFGGDRNAMTAIALVTFAYALAGREPEARHGPKDILLVKVLAKKERSRRKGDAGPSGGWWGAPVFELIAGEAGDRVRAMKTINAPG